MGGLTKKRRRRRKPIPLEPAGLRAALLAGWVCIGGRLICPACRRPLEP